MAASRPRTSPATRSADTSRCSSPRQRGRWLRWRPPEAGPRRHVALETLAHRRRCTSAANGCGPRRRDRRDGRGAAAGDAGSDDELRAHSGRAGRAPDRGRGLVRGGCATHRVCPAQAARRDVALCIVWGRADRLRPGPRQLRAIATTGMPHADWVVLDGVGHCPQLDIPLETAELISGLTAAEALEGAQRPLERGSELGGTGAVVERASPVGQKLDRAGDTAGGDGLLQRVEPCREPLEAGAVGGGRAGVDDRRPVHGRARALPAHVTQRSRQRAPPARGNELRHPVADELVRRRRPDAPGQPAVELPAPLRQAGLGPQRASEAQAHRARHHGCCRGSRQALKCVCRHREWRRREVWARRPHRPKRE